MMDKVSHTYLQLAMQISKGKHWGFLFMDLLTKMIQDSNFTLSYLRDFGINNLCAHNILRFLIEKNKK